jgi:hypothetical protein
MVTLRGPDAAFRRPVVAGARLGPVDQTEPGVTTAGVAPSGSIEWAREYVYGTISTMVAIGGLSLENRPDSVSAGGVIVVGAIAIALAHAVSHLVVAWSNRSDDAPFTSRTVTDQLRRSWPIVSAAIPATIVLAISRTGLYTTSTALWIDAGVGVGALAVVGILTAGPARPDSHRVLYVLALISVGLFIVGLEVAAHQL